MSLNNRKELWYEALTTFENNYNSNIETLLEEDLKRVSVIQQLDEVGFENVDELDPDLNFVILSVDSEDPSLNLKLEFPKAYPKEPVYISPASQISTSQRYCFSSF